MGAGWSTFTNRIEYMFSDPRAEEYAKKKATREAQQAADAKQATIVAEGHLTEKQKKDAAAALSAKQAADRAELATRSQFNIAQLVGQSSDGIYFHVKALLLLCFMIYGGHIAVNQAIGYNVPFRILTFVYGMLCSPWIVPKALYDRYWSNKELPYFAFFPLSTHVPRGDLETYIVGPFCYTETGGNVTAAQKEVINLYKGGFKAVAAVAGSAAVSAALAAPTAALAAPTAALAAPTAALAAPTAALAASAALAGTATTKVVAEAAAEAAALL